VNILNLLAALTAAHARGVPFADLVESVPRSSRFPAAFSPSMRASPSP
jgi:UDP-N-acetylmuramoyl-L-alanyl-D-glutamate--2,6-diaminopimelate ligase